MPSVVLVPGTQATELVDANGNVAYSASGLAILSMLGPLRAARVGRHPPEAWAELLSLQYEDGALDPEPVSVKLRIGRILRTPYEPIYHAFGDELVEYPYDWRLDIVANGRDLLAELRRPSDAPDGRWRVMAHSQGGLLVVAAASLVGPDAFGALVSHVAFVGVPFAGTLKAAAALLWGRDDFGAEDEWVGVLREAARSWPSIYQMLPAWDAVQQADGPAPPDRQLLSTSGWPSDAPLDADQVQHLARAEAFQAMVRDWVRDPGSIRFVAVMGLGQDTPHALRLGRGRLPDGLEGQPHEAGDSLVPGPTTLKWAAGDLNGPVHFLRPNLEHSLLFKDLEVRDLLRAFFADRGP